MSVGSAKVRAISEKEASVEVEFNCPWCGVLSRVKCVVGHTWVHDDWVHYYVLTVCPSSQCRRGSLVVARDKYRYLFRYPDVELECTVYPAEQSDYAPEGVPDEIAEEFREAQDCATAGFHIGAALVGRRVLQAAVRHVLGKKLYKLEDEINEIPDDRLNKALKDQAHHVRYLGNDAAHVDPVIPEEVEELLEFVDQVLDALFVSPERLRKLQAARDARRGTAKTRVAQGGAAAPATATAPATAAAQAPASQQSPGGKSNLPKPPPTVRVSAPAQAEPPTKKD